MKSLTFFVVIVSIVSIVRGGVIMKMFLNGLFGGALASTIVLVLIFGRFGLHCS